MKEGVCVKRTSHGYKIGDGYISQKAMDNIFKKTEEAIFENLNLSKMSLAALDFLFEEIHFKFMVLVTLMILTEDEKVRGEEK